MVARQLRDARHHRRARPRRDGRDPARGVRPRRQPSRRLRRRGPADRGRPDDQPAGHGRQDDRAPRASEPGDRILEIGTGSGYQAAILAWLGADVDLARAPGGARRPRRANVSTRSGSPGSVEVREADGSLGDPAGAPVGRDHRHGRRAGRSRRRCATSSRDGGRLVIPVGPRDRQILTVVDPARRRVARADRRLLRLRPAHRRRRLRGLSDATTGRCRSVYSAGHDPCLRRAASGRRRALVRRPHRQPPRARPDRHDPDRLLGRRLGRPA